MDSNHRFLSRGNRFILQKVNCGGIDGAAKKFCGYRWFESISLQRRVRREPDFLRRSLRDLCRSLAQHRELTSRSPANAKGCIEKTGMIACVATIPPKSLVKEQPRQPQAGNLDMRHYPRLREPAAPAAVCDPLPILSPAHHPYHPAGFISATSSPFAVTATDWAKSGAPAC